MNKKNAGTLEGIILILPVTLVVMGAVLLAPIMTKLMEAFGHINYANILVPILISLPALCIALFAPVAGIMADKIGRRRLLITAMTIYGCLGTLPVILDSYLPLLLSRIGVGLCEAVIITCSTALIGDHFHGPKRDKWLGSQAALSTFSAMLLFPISGALGATFGWQGPFAIYSVALLMMLLVVVFIKDVPASKEPQSDTTEAFPWAHVLKACGFTLFGGVMFYVLQFQMGNALTAFGIDEPAQTGLSLSIASIGIILGALLFRVANQRVTLKRLVAIEFMLIALGFFGMSVATSPTMLVVSGFINQLGAGLMLPTLLTWAVSPLKYVFRGKGTGIWQSTFAIGQFTSSITFALVLGLLGKENILNAFAVYGTVSLIMVFMAIKFVKEHSTTAKG